MHDKGNVVGLQVFIVPEPSTWVLGTGGIACAGVVAKWLGHSPKIAAQHYLMSREHHFDDVVAGGGAAEPIVAAAGDVVPSSCSADCSAPATQNATQQASAPDSARPHKTTKPAATIQVAAGSSKLAPVTETDRMAGTGFEPATSRL